MPTTVKVLLVEDHLITRIGLRMILEEAPDIEIVDEAEDGQAALDKALALHPHVVLMDIGLPILDGVECARRIKLSSSDIGILVRSSHEEPRAIINALAAGANGYCLKDSSDQVLLEAIKAVANSRFWIDPRVAQQLLLYARKPHHLQFAEAKDNVLLSAEDVSLLSALASGSETGQTSLDSNCSADLIRIINKLNRA